jgi:regulatory protein
MAQKKRLGPWARVQDPGGDPLGQRKAHEKAVAAMLRAGHQYAHVRFILGAAEPGDVDQWLAEAADEGETGQW